MGKNSNMKPRPRRIPLTAGPTGQGETPKDPAKAGPTGQGETPKDKLRLPTGQGERERERE